MTNQPMADDPNERMKTARDLMNMTPEELVVWAVGRQANDPVRAPAVQLEFERRVAGPAKETAEYTKANARYMLWSVIVLAVSAVITAMVTILSTWLASQGPPP